jgi:hypothetical protein
MIRINTRRPSGPLRPYDYTVSYWPEYAQPDEHREINYSSKAHEMLLADGWDDHTHYVEHPLVRRWKRVVSTTKVKPPRFLCLRMNAKQIIDAYNRGKDAFLAVPRVYSRLRALKQLGWTMHRVLMVAGAILSDKQLAFLARAVTYRGLNVTVLARYTRRKITWEQLASLVIFGHVQSKRHQQATRLALTASSVFYCQTVRSIKVSSEVFWEELLLCQQINSGTKSDQLDIYFMWASEAHRTAELNEDKVDALIKAGVSPLSLFSGLMERPRSFISVKNERKAASAEPVPVEVA